MLREKIIGSKIKGNEVNYLTLAKPIDQDDTDFLQTDLLSAKEILKLIQNVQSADDSVELLDPNKYAYGIQMLFTDIENGSQIYSIDRIGNPELHKTLPIQSKFATCIHQGTNIKYWCDPNDSRFRKDTERYKFNVELSIKETTTSNNTPKTDDYSPCTTYTHIIKFKNTDINKNSELNDLVTTYKYLYAWIKINNVVCRINKIDFENKELYITSEDSIPNETLFDIELGCSINGYDGEIGVYTPKFYIWISHQEQTGIHQYLKNIIDTPSCNIFISEKKCVNNCTEVKSHITSISHCTVLKHKMNDNKWGWLNTLSDDTAVCVVNYQPNLRGGLSGSEYYDDQLKDGVSISALGKGFLCRSLDEARKYSSKNNNGKVLYYQMWNAILLCYFIEYCTIAISNPYVKELQEGLHTGGLCDPENKLRFCEMTKLKSPLIPIDYTLCLGNNSGVVFNRNKIDDVKQPTTANWNDVIVPYDIASKNQIIVDSDDNSLLHIKCDKKYSFVDGSDSYNIIKLRVISNYTSVKITGINNNKKVQVFYYTHPKKPEFYDLENSSNYIGNIADFVDSDGHDYIIFRIYGPGIDLKLNTDEPIETINLDPINQFVVPNYRGFNMFFGMCDVSMYIENLLYVKKLKKIDNLGTPYYYNPDDTLLINSIYFGTNTKNQFNDSLNNKKCYNNIGAYYVSGPYYNNRYPENILVDVYDNKILLLQPSGFGMQGVNNLCDSLSFVSQNLIENKSDQYISYMTTVPYTYYKFNDSNTIISSGLLSLKNSDYINTNSGSSAFSKCYTLN